MKRFLAFAPLATGHALAVVAGLAASALAASPDLDHLRAMAARFKPTEIRADVSGLSPGDRRALAKLMQASREMDSLYMRQLWSGDAELFARLKANATPLGKARRRYFWLMKGPWSSLDEQAAFLPGVPPRKPLGANFYPEDMTKEEFEAWVQSLPAAEQEKAKGFFTVIRRAGKRLLYVPFSKEYSKDLRRVAELLRQAASATDNASLKKFLALRAEALLSDDYFASDVAWMDLDAPLELTFGPYETYNDELFGYKAAFESYVTLRDDKETARLSAFSKNLQQIEDHLPIPAEHRNPKLGALAPIRVVNEVFCAGDAAHGVQSAAFNLPNDDRVVAQKGSKRVMLKNVQEAKFNSVLAPISGKVLAEGERGLASFDSFFSHILAHELSHGLGPHQIKVAGRDTTPREELKDLYGAIEESKADVLGLFALQYFMDNAERLGIKGLSAGPEAEKRLYATYLASAFRTLRFGLAEAHGKGMALQLNYLLDKKAVVANADGTFGVDYSRIKDAVRDLAHDLLMIEAAGDRPGAEKLLASLGVMRPKVQAAIGRLGGIPVDIEPIFKTVEELSRRPTGKPAKG